VLINLRCVIEEGGFWLVDVRGAWNVEHQASECLDTKPTVLSRRKYVGSPDKIDVKISDARTA
jgi:hypothetical protein